MYPNVFKFESTVEDSADFFILADGHEERHMNQHLWLGIEV